MVAVDHHEVIRGSRLGRTRLQFAERDQHAARAGAEGVLLRLPHVEQDHRLPGVEHVLQVGRLNLGNH